MATTADIAEDPASPHPCGNCGTALTGAHCHGCGQSAHVHRSVAAIGHDLLHGVLHLDGKLANTLPLLALKPGQLTRRYIGGERRRFVSPMGLFLFSVTVLFLTMQALGTHIGEISEQASVGPALARADRALTNTIVAPLPDSAYTKGTAVGVELGGDDHPSVERRQKQQMVRARAVKTLAVVRQARGIWTQDGDLETIKGNSNNAWGNKIIEKAKTDPALLIYKMQANSYKFSWALIPLSVPFVWLLFFWRRDVGLYDHTVFVTYSIATMTLLTAILVILSRLGLRDTWLLSTLMLLAPLHIFVHLRGSYVLSKRATTVRFLFLSVFIWLAVGLFAIILLALGALS